MKVYIDTSPLYSGHQMRGIGRYTKELIKALEKTGQKIITPENGEAKQADLVHYPYFDLFTHSLPFWIRQPTVVTIHDVIPLEFPKQYAPGKRGSLNLILQELSLKFVNAVITDSDYSKQQISTLLRVPASKIQVVRLAANSQLTLKNATPFANISARYNLPKKYILYVGDINYNKNIPELIKTLEFLPQEVKLVCVGKNFKTQAIPEWHAITDALQANHLEERVIFLNSVDADNMADLAGIYHHAVCYVQPSLSEGFGLPILEAMQCETPVISTELGSLPEVGGEAVLYADPNAESLAADVKEVLSWSKSSRSKFVKQAAEWARTFSWEKTALQTIEVYQKVLQ